MSTPDVISAAPLGELTPEQKKERYARLRQQMGKSKLEVIGDPKKHYFWASMDDGTEMARLEGLEYSIVREPNAVAILAGKARAKVQANYLKADGTYNNGDVILMMCDMDVYEYIMGLNSERHEQMAQGAQRDFRTEAERLAVPVFDKQK